VELQWTTSHADEPRANRDHAGVCNVRGCVEERDLDGKERDDLERDRGSEIG
jgi:hypothetical protein